MDFVVLVAARRAIQHDALSTKPSNDPLYKMCRLAIIVFLAECIEPMSILWPFHKYSSRALMLALDDCDRLGHWETRPELLLWATIVGGFAARETPLRWWYFEQIRSFPRNRPAGQSWDDVQKMAERYLPFKYRHGQGCQKFWEDARAWTSHDRYTLVERVKGDDHLQPPQEEA